MFIESKSCACHEVYQDDFPGHQQIHQVKILNNDGGGGGWILQRSCKPDIRDTWKHYRNQQMYISRKILQRYLGYEIST